VEQRQMLGWRASESHREMRSRRCRRVVVVFLVVELLLKLEHR